MKKLTALLALLALCLLAAPAAFADEVEVEYLDENGGNPVVSATVVTQEVTTWSGTTEAPGWYVVRDNGVTITGAVTVNGNVNLILADGASLTVSGGIVVNQGNSFTIYAQSDATKDGNKAGALTATGGYCAAGIGGGEFGSSGTVTIHGGNVTATGGYGGAGGTITISGGVVMATAGSISDYAGNGSPGIGSGGTSYASYTIKITGGDVTAKGSKNGAGIGSGYEGVGGTGTIEISGGVVKATGGSYGAGIGGGEKGSVGTITITGGVVNAHGSSGGACIGGGARGDGGDVTISGGNVTATTYGGGQGIGAGQYGGSGGTFTTTENGNAVIRASSISDNTDTSNWSGIICESWKTSGPNSYIVYGTPTLGQDLTLASGQTLTVGQDATLTVGQDATLTVASDAFLNVPAGAALTVAGTMTVTDTDGLTVTGGLDLQAGGVLKVGNTDYYPLTLSCQGNGTATANGQSMGNAFAAGSPVTLTATPNAGYRLAGWRSTEGATITGNTFNMPDVAVEITAVFEAIPPAGGGSGQPAATATLAPTAAPTATPKPAATARPTAEPTPSPSPAATEAPAAAAEATPSPSPEALPGEAVPEEAAPAQGQAGPAWLLALLALALALLRRKRRQGGE